MNVVARSLDTFSTFDMLLATKEVLNILNFGKSGNPNLLLLLSLLGAFFGDALLFRSNQD